jgi:transcriptional regulator of acetoin/glycerol metabolism
VPEHSEIREELRELGKRRKLQHASRYKLATEVEGCLHRAYHSSVTVAEAARLLGLHRTTVYRVYLRLETADG